jgi:glyoxylase I family protein
MDSKTLKARYVHTNLVARDWRALSEFYQQVFGCVPVPPKRELQGQWLEKGSGVPGARLQGMHLRLPGHGPHGPTLEIFQYGESVPGGLPAANRTGLGHLAFEVDQVEQALRALLAAGGSKLGEIVNAEVSGAGTITWTYARDPEGNIIELQSWA